MSMITDTHYGKPEPTVKAIICLTCEKNSQEGSDLFSLKGALAHCKAYCVSGPGPLDGTTHGGYEQIEIQAEYVAVMGGLCDGPGAAHD